MKNSEIKSRELIEVIFNSIAKGSLTKEYEATAIAEAINTVYSKVEDQEEMIEKQYDLLTQQSNVIQDLMFKIDSLEKAGK